MGKKIVVIIGVFLLASVISYFILDVNEKQFSKTQWDKHPLTRYKMTTDLLESRLLINKTEEEVITLLGAPRPSTLTGRAHLVFDLGTPPGFFETAPETLVVIFDDGKVVKVVHKHK